MHVCSHIIVYTVLYIPERAKCGHNNLHLRNIHAYFYTSIIYNSKGPTVQYGPIPSTFPSPSLPHVNVELCGRARLALGKITEAESPVSKESPKVYIGICLYIICMWMCIYIYMCVQMIIFTYTYDYVCRHTCLYIVYIYMYIYIWLRIYAHVLIYVSVCICIYICACVYIYMHMYISRYMHLYICMYIHMHMYI